jgi:putative NADH-flavin reductase
MRLCIFGASGRTGSALIRQALGRGHSVTAFYRSDSRASPPPDVNIVWGDLFCRGDIDRAVRDADAVVCLYGQRPPRYHTLFSPVTADVIEAMKAHGARRLLFISDVLTGSGCFKHSLFATAMHWLIRKRHPALAQDRVQQEDLVEESGLKWTIIKTPRLTAGPRTGKYRIGANLKVKVFSRVSREDLSAAILDQLDSAEFVGKQVVLQY